MSGFPLREHFAMEQVQKTKAVSGRKLAKAANRKRKEVYKRSKSLTCCYAYPQMISDKFSTSKLTLKLLWICLFDELFCYCLLTQFFAMFWKLTHSTFVLFFKKGIFKFKLCSQNSFLALIWIQFNKKFCLFWSNFNQYRPSNRNQFHA